MNSLLAVSTEFGQGSSNGEVKTTYGLLDSYEYAGKYHYGALTTMSMSYGPTTCTQANSLSGTYTSLVNGGPNATVYLDQHFSTCGSPSYTERSSYIWVVGEVNPCACTGIAPGSYMGTWVDVQFGPVVQGMQGSFSVWIR
jgi:hypothetical protein